MTKRQNCQSYLSEVNAIMRGILTVFLMLVVAAWTVAQDKTDTKSAKKYVIEEVDKSGADGKRLEILEAKLQALLKEIKELRAAKPSTSAQARIVEVPLQPRVGAGGEVKKGEVIGRVENAKPVEGKRVVVIGDVGAVKDGKPVQHEILARSESNVVTLTRATYQLPAASAKALGDFLASQVKAKVLETKLDGDKLTVTTTPEVQHTIAGIVALMQGKEPRATPRFYFHKIETEPGKPATIQFDGPSLTKPAVDVLRLELDAMRKTAEKAKEFRFELPEIKETIEKAKSFRIELVPSEVEYLFKLKKPQDDVPSAPPQKK